MCAYKMSIRRIRFEQFALCKEASKYWKRFDILSMKEDVYDIDLQNEI